MMTKEQVIAVTVLAMYQCGVDMMTRRRVVDMILQQMDLLDD